MDSIRNFVQLTTNIGTAGQPRAEQFQLIADQGYRHVINLGLSSHSDAVVDEDKRLADLGLNYFHIPVPFDHPRPEQVRRFCLLMDMLRDDKVFVHCIMNYRASAFLYQYLTKLAGYDEASARSPMLDSWTPPAVWQELLSWTRQDIGLV
ncbi:protein tyrosine phosphatase family protein [Saccharospirillum sp. HFRX-1]|uniref:protein tyrosine phosphatase family protein n=1 Tax=unclassified Saccharospirillum TaxID=2633430 RepID=UPI00371EC9C3